MSLLRNASISAGSARLTIGRGDRPAQDALRTPPKRGVHATLMRVRPKLVALPLRGTADGATFSSHDIAGFTLMEMVLVIVLIGIIGAMFFPQVSRMTGKNSVARAAQVVQQDLQRAFTLAGRARKPVTLTADNSAHTYQVTDPSGNIMLTRRLSVGQEYGVETMTFNPTTLTIQPNGVSSDTLGVTLTSNGSTRYVSMTRVGLIRRTQ